MTNGILYIAGLATGGQSEMFAILVPVISLCYPQDGNSLQTSLTGITSDMHGTAWRNFISIEQEMNIWEKRALILDITRNLDS